MAGYRKLGRTSSQRKALLRNQVTDLLYYGKIVTTEAKAKEIRKIAEGIIALGVKECNNFDTVKVTAKVARKDKDGKRVKEVVDGKKVTVFTVTEVPTDKQSRRKDTKKVDVVSKVLDDIAPKYTDRNGGYTRIVKIGQRKGDAAMEVLIELV